MNRRGFLGALAAALVLRKMPIELPVVQPPLRTTFPEGYQFKKYELGFQITQEMLDDDLYATLRQHGRRQRRRR